MPRETQIFRRQLRSGTADIAQLADALPDWAEACGMTKKTARYLSLMLDELIANIAEHAYGGREDGPIDVLAEFDGANVCLTLRDAGPPFDPTQLAPAALQGDVDQREPGGLGVHFVRQIADEFRYRRMEGGNEVFVRKAVDGSLIGEKS